MGRAVKAAFGLILVLTLVACGGNKVDDSMAKKYVTKAEKIIHLLNEGNYKKVHAMFDDKMKTGLLVKDMKELTPVIRKSGDFKEIEKTPRNIDIPEPLWKLDKEGGGELA
jgi:hypothetical protein